MPPARKKKSERKDRVVQARVNEELDEALKEEAARRRLPVSQLVRTLLEDTFNLVGNVVDNVDTVAQDAIGLGRQVASDARRLGRGARRDAPPPAPEVYGWQPIVPNQDQVCSNCGTALPRGGNAFVGLTDAAGPRPWLCQTCRDLL